MVGIAGDVARGCALHSASGVREAVPNGFALAVLVPVAFDLVGGGGGAPDKFFGKLERLVTSLWLEKITNEAVAGSQYLKRRGRTKSSAEKFAAIEGILARH